MSTLNIVNGAVATSSPLLAHTQHSSAWLQWAHGVFLACGMLLVTMVVCWSMYRVMVTVWDALKWDEQESGTMPEVAHAPPACAHGSFVPGVHGSNPPMKCVACELSHVLTVHAQLEDGLFRTRAILSKIQSSSTHTCHE